MQMQVGQPINPFARRITSAVRVLIIVTMAFFVIQTIVDRTSPSESAFTASFALHLGGLVKLYIWQPVTYMFLHSGVWHILWNMLLLYWFGCETEETLGTRRFVKLYLGTGVIAGLGWALLTFAMGRNALCLGASGAVLGVVGAYAGMFPQRRLTLLLFFFLPVSMTALTLAIGIGVISLFLLITGDRDVAHAAHLAGGIAGYLYGVHIARHPRVLDPMLNPLPVGPLTRFRAWLMRRRMHVVDEPEGPPAPEEVDRILEKIKREGIDKLSRKERHILDQASRHGK